MADRDGKGRFLVRTEPGPGRTSGYDSSMNEQAHKLALLGLTDEEMARFFDVSRNTLHRWKTEHPGFCDAVQRGKEIADAEVAHALFKRATGMRVTSEKAMKGKDGGIVITQTVTEIPPDTKAAVHWLQVRRRGAWESAKEHSDVSRAQNATPPRPTLDTLRSMSDEELQERIKEIEARRQF